MQIPVRRVIRPDDTAIVEVSGEIDFTNSDALSEEIQDAVRSLRPRMLRVDLRNASFIDSTGLGALISGYRTAVEQQVEFVVVNPSDAFRRVLTVTGLCELFGLPVEDPAAGDRASDVAI